MNGIKTFSQLKAEARNALPGRMMSALGAVLLYLLWVIALSGFPAALAPDHLFLGPFIIIVMSFLVNILIQMQGIGLRFRFMKLLFEAAPVPGDSTVAFRGDPDRAVGLCGRRALLYSLCMLPATLFSLTLPGDMILRQSPVFLLFFIAGRLAALFFHLSFLCSDYLFLEYPGLSPKELLRLSRRLISGKRKRLLLFYLSYLPLHLLALVSFGLTEPLVLCYVYAGEAAFYTDLVKTAAGTA